MPKYAAFLRAVNLGGRTVKMDKLREIFAGLGFDNVETFIASGNVIFDSKSKDGGALEKRIAAELERALGFEVATFVRTTKELAAISEYGAFPKALLGLAAAYNVAFLAGEPAGDRVAALRALEDELHSFHVRGREMYWLSKVKQSEAKFKTNDFERALGMKMTLRGINTVRRMTERWCR